MTALSLQNQIDRLEQQFKAVASLVADDQATALTSGCEALQQLSVELAQTFDSLPPLAVPGPILLRLKELSQGITVLRENLLRRAAYVDYALSVVVPIAPKATYGTTTGPYGTLARQTGAFKVLAA
jgi:hypothetical protein